MAGGSTSSRPRYAPDDPTLPKPWRALVDGSTGYLYYWNPETNVTQYERPSDELPPPPPLLPPPPPLLPPKSASVIAVSSSTVQADRSRHHQDDRRHRHEDDDRHDRSRNHQVWLLHALRNNCFLISFNKSSGETLFWIRRTLFKWSIPSHLRYPKSNLVKWLR